MVPRLRQRYEEEAIPKLVEEFSYANINQVPRVAKVVVNIGLGEATQNSKLIDAAAEELRAITGQKPAIRRAKGSVETATEDPGERRLREEATAPLGSAKTGTKCGQAQAHRDERLYETGTG